MLVHHKSLLVDGRVVVVVVGQRRDHNISLSTWLRMCVFSSTLLHWRRRRCSWGPRRGILRRRRQCSRRQRCPCCRVSCQRQRATCIKASSCRCGNDASTGENAAPTGGPAQWWLCSKRGTFSVGYKNHSLCAVIIFIRSLDRADFLCLELVLAYARELKKETRLKRTYFAMLFKLSASHLQFSDPLTCN